MLRSNSSSHPLIHSSPHPLAHSSPLPITRSSTNPLIPSSTPSIIHLFTHQPLHSSTHPLIHLSNHPLIQSSNHPLIYSTHLRSPLLAQTLSKPVSDGPLGDFFLDTSLQLLSRQQLLVLQTLLNIHGPIGQHHQDIVEGNLMTLKGEEKNGSWGSAPRIWGRPEVDSGRLIYC